ncbi:MAG: hypothetical protein AB7G37_04915 [Solirubrobacteraceae bacterium]
MYHLSRALYRDVHRSLPPDSGRERQEHVLHACESTIQRLVRDPHYFAHPAKTLFHEIRFLFPIAEQARVWQAVRLHVGGLAAQLRNDPSLSHDLCGTKPTCQATTRRGQPCQRDPLEGSRYCPSHQHLTETEELDAEFERALMEDAAVAA